MLDVTDYPAVLAWRRVAGITPFAVHPYNQGWLGLSPKSSLETDIKKQIGGRQKVKIERFISIAKESFARGRAGPK